jgi:tRNA G18 (ribose-2'-O)-methylase SpoU
VGQLKQQYEAQGFYGIGVHFAEHETNIGTLWRSAYVLGAASFSP